MKTLVRLSRTAAALLFFFAVSPVLLLFALTVRGPNGVEARRFLREELGPFLRSLWSRE